MPHVITRLAVATAMVLSAMPHLMAGQNDAPKSKDVGDDMGELTGATPLTPDIVTQYLSWISSKRNKGLSMPRDGKVHKWQLPLRIHVDWPTCEPIARQTVEALHEKTGLPITFESGPDWNDLSGIFILGVDGLETVKKQTDLYRAINLLFIGRNKNDLDNLMKYIGDNQGLIKRTITRTDNIYSPDLSVTIISDKLSGGGDCTSVQLLIVGNIINSDRLPSKYGVSNLDYMYTKALYDSSIKSGDSERKTAKNIKKIMINDIVKVQDEQKRPQ